jgi:hypothetical protein
MYFCTSRVLVTVKNNNQLRFSSKKVRKTLRRVGKKLRAAANPSLKREFKFSDAKLLKKIFEIASYLDG